MRKKKLKIIIATLICIIMLNNICFADIIIYNNNNKEISFIPNYFYAIIICTIIIVSVILIANYKIKKEKILAILIQEKEENKNEEELENIENYIKKLSKIKFKFYLILLFMYFITSFINIFIFNKIILLIYIITTILVMFYFYKKDYKKSMNIFRIAVIIATIISIYYNIKVISFNSDITNNLIYRDDYRFDYIVLDDQIDTLIIRVKANNIEKKKNKIIFEYAQKEYYTDYELAELQKQIEDFRERKLNQTIKANNEEITSARLLLEYWQNPGWEIKLEKDNKGYIKKIIILDKEKELEYE